MCVLGMGSYGDVFMNIRDRDPVSSLSCTIKITAIDDFF